MDKVVAEEAGHSGRFAGRCTCLLVLACLCSCSSAVIGSTQRLSARIRPGRPSPDGYIVVLRQEPAAAAAAKAAEASTAQDPAQDAAAATASVQAESVSPRAYVQRASVQAVAQQVDADVSDTASRAGISSKVRYRYRYTLSGFSTSALSREEINVLRQDPKVLGVYKDGLVRGRTYSTPRFLGLSGAAADGSNGAWPQVGGRGPNKAGEGVVIGVLDSGVWPETGCFSDRTNLGDSGRFAYSKLNSSYYTGVCYAGEQFSAAQCNRKVIGCRWYNRGLVGDGDIRSLYPDDMNSCRDAQGHGGHTASIAAGNFGPLHPAGVTSGMAPRARIAVYKVLWGPEVHGAFSDVSAAIDQAVEDGVDVIVYSGGADQPSKSFRRLNDMTMMYAAEAGVFIAGACGNTGPTPSTVDYQVPWVMSVAASTHDRAMRATVQLGNGRTFTSASVSDWPLGPLDLVLGGSLAVSAAYRADAVLCLPGSLSLSRATGKVVVCDRGSDYDFGSKADEVKRVGGAAMLLVNVDADANDILAQKFSVPTFHLPRSVRTAIRTYAARRGARITLAPAQAVFQQLAPQMAVFSSRGPGLAGGGAIVKPDVTAPGVEVFAAWSPGDDSTPLQYAYRSGTSSSAPHVAGLAALLRQKYPTWSAMAIKSALMTTAYQTTRTGTPGMPFGTPFDFGAGHVDPVRMFNPGLVFDSNLRDWLNFLCGVERWPEDPFCGPCDSSRPPDSCDPANLNTPSIALPGLTVGVSKTVVRVLKNVLPIGTNFRASVSYEGNAARFISISVNPTTVWINSETSRKVGITVEVKDGAVHDRYYFAAITWTGSTGTVTRIPVAVSASLILVPEEVASPIRSRVVSHSFVPAFSGLMTLIPKGLVPASVVQQSIRVDEELFVQIVAPAGTMYAAFRLFQDDLPPGDFDLDLCLVDGEKYVDCQESPTSDEGLYISFNTPIQAPRKYVLSIYAYKAPGGSVTFSLYSWFVTNEQSKNMLILPSSFVAQAGIRATVQLSVEEISRAGNPAPRYLGLIEHTKDGAVLETTRVLVSG